MTLTDDQAALLRDKYVLWERASREGPMDLRDYNRRAAEALKAALMIASEHLTAKAEESSVEAPQAAQVRIRSVGWWDDDDGGDRYFRIICALDGDTPPVWPIGLIWNSSFTLTPTPPKAEVDHG